MELKDSHGKYLTKEMLSMVKTNGNGWVEYMWPKPGESVSTLKSTYVSKARSGTEWLLVGCGAYLSDAPRAADGGGRMSATGLTDLVRDAAGYPSFVGSREPTNRHLGAVTCIDFACPSRNSGFTPAVWYGFQPEEWYILESVCTWHFRKSSKTG